MSLWRLFGRLTDGTVRWMGRLAGLLILYCMAFGVTDVALRYLFNAPSQWIGASLQAAMVLMACLGGAYALKHGAFVKLDLFYARASRRNRALLDVLTAPLAFIFLGVLIWKGIDAAAMSIRLRQVTPTAVPIPIYPIKAFIPVAAAVVLGVVLKQFVADCRTLVLGPERTRRAQAHEERNEQRSAT